MLNLALGIMVFLLVSQAYSQEASIQNLTPTPQAVPLVVVSDEKKLEALQQQLLNMQEQLEEMKKAKQAPVESSVVHTTPVEPAKPAIEAVPVAPPVVVVPSAPAAPAAAPVVIAEPVKPVATPKKAFHQFDDEFDEMEYLARRRPRNHVLTWRYAYAYEKHKVTTSGSGVSDHVDGNRSEMEFEYARNFAAFELGVYLSGIRSEDNSGAAYVSTDAGIVARLNFVENRLGRDLIPYASGYAGGLSFLTEGSPDVKLSGGYLGLGLGFNWFPFSEIFAFNMEYKYYSAGLETDTTPKVSTDTDLWGLSVGWRLYF